MSAAPEWVLRVILFAVAVGCVALVFFSAPLYSRVVNARQNPLSSKVIVVTAVASVIAAALWFFVFWTVTLKPIELRAHIPAPSFEAGIDVHGITWNKSWIPVYLDILNRGS